MVLCSLLQELFAGSRYKMTVDNDVYKLIISPPKYDDMGRYTCDIGGITTSCYLTVEGNQIIMKSQSYLINIRCYLWLIAEPDVIYSFTKQLLKKSQGYLKREFELECTASSHKAPVQWYKGETRIELDDSKYEIVKELTGVCRLIIKSPVKGDHGEYSCRVEKQDLKTASKVTFIGKLLLLKFDIQLIFYFLIITFLKLINKHLKHGSIQL